LVLFITSGYCATGLESGKKSIYKRVEHRSDHRLYESILLPIPFRCLLGEGLIQPS